MKSIRQFVPVLAGIIGVSGAWGALGVGCGSSSSGSSSTEDGGPGDATTDAKQDAQPDVLLEAAADASPGTDADAVAPGDSAPPDAEAGPDAGVFQGDPAAFAGQVATALCDLIAACCETSLDAATFNKALCLADELPEGFHGSNLGTELLDGGNITFNASTAQLCISSISSLGCVPNEITSAQEATLFQTCLGAFTGTLTVGSPCQGSIECAPGSFCLPGAGDAGAVDGGPIGLCEPLAGDGGACGVYPGSTDTVIAQSACSYRGAAANGLFCQSFDAGAPLNKFDAAAWTCAPQEGIGTGCFNGVDCTSLLCDPAALECAAATEILTLSSCPAFLLDAGAGD
jgi:hypothetical protein